MLQRFMCLFGPPPKDPPTKNTTESKFGTGTKFATMIAKRRGECSEMLGFLGAKDRKKVKTMAVAKYYGFERRTIFGAAGCLGFVSAETSVRPSNSLKSKHVGVDIHHPKAAAVHDPRAV